jgi:hypothetical protein
MTDSFAKEMARVSDMRNVFSEIKLRIPPTPVGWWVIGEGFHVALYEKPTAKHIKNHQEMLGWKWRDAE